jgi:phage repressor protein C with HTH and peptisase S24 domain
MHWRRSTICRRPAGEAPAGLDPKHLTEQKGGANGKAALPSTKESVSKVLRHRASLDVICGADQTRGRVRSYTRSVPCRRPAQAGNSGYFDDAGFPAGAGWDEIPFPELADEHAYALEITGESMLPVYRDGDRIVVSPSASVRRGDRVVVKTQAGEVMAKQLSRHSAQRVELKSFNPAFEDRGFALNEVAFMHRIIWASQ